MVVNTNFNTTNNQILNYSQKPSLESNNLPVNVQNKVDKVEIQGKKPDLSTNAKIGIGLGIVGTIIGGILLRKSLTNKVSSQGQQVAQELGQAINSRLTSKELDLFESIKNLEGDEFISKAYDLIAKDMGLPKYPKLNIDHTTCASRSLGHAGREITVFPDNYPVENRKAQILGTLRHELEHYKQSLIIFMRKGDKQYEEAFKAQIMRRIRTQANIREEELNEVLSIDELINTQILEEYQRYGFSNIDQVISDRDMINVRIISGNQNISFDDLIKRAFEHDTPIETIRKMTPCDFDKLHFTEEELAKADSYLEGIRNYALIAWLPSGFVQNGRAIPEKVGANVSACEFFSSLKERYLYNIIETEATRIGDSLRDKFIEFLSALNL